MSADTSGLAALPSIDRLLELAPVMDGVERHGRARVVGALRAAVDDARVLVRAGAPPPPAAEVAATALATLEQQRRGRTRRVVNATGVVLHTNLGRVPLSPAAADAARSASGYTNLEYDLEAGERGGRGAYAAALLAEICGSESATVVNNGAGALVLSLAALGAGRGTLVSRGELVEIGGSFRLPEIMGSAGTVLHEVGTTNRTRAADYAHAVDEDTALLLQVHPSNFRIVGFHQRPTTDELAEVARTAGIPLVVDIGSGLLDGTEVLRDEPVPSDVLARGADLVLFSGDKLAGGPQAGVVAGRRDLVDACRRHPLARALRIDKLRLAALEVTLEEHLRGDASPTRRMLTATHRELRARAQQLAARLGGTVTGVDSVVGGGAAPGVDLPSAGIALDGPADAVLTALRRADPPVVARIIDDRVVLDVRTLQEEDLAPLAAAVQALRDHGLLSP